MRRRPSVLLGVWCCSLATIAWAASINTDVLQRPWRGERVRELEVGRYPVRWREKLDRREGILAGVRFEAARDRQAVWKLASDYHDLGAKTPGVTAVRFLEQTPTRQVIQIDVHVLWKSLQLRFEVEQDPPQAMRFRLVNQALGTYQGVATFEEVSAPAGPSTVVELSTQLQPSRPVPRGLLLLVERMTLLSGVKEFLATCQRRTEEVEVFDTRQHP